MTDFRIIEEKPRIILMVNDIVGLEVTRFLIERKEHIVALFLHNKEDQKHVEDILGMVNWVISSDDIYLASTLKSKDIVQILTSYEPDVIITCYWAHLLTQDIIDIPKYGCINFHPGLLPQNRGWYPAVWPFIDGSKAGVTIHKIDEGADTGPIIAQAETEISELDTLGSVYKQHQDLMISLFKDTWPKLRDGIELKYQNHSKATYHSKKDGNALNEIDLEKTYKAKDFMNLIKARMFGDKSFAYYKKDGDTYRVKLIITKE